MRFSFKKTLAILIGLLITAVLATSSLQGVSAVTVISQLGSDIDGEAAGDQSGISVAMSTDGNRIAIGAIQNDGGGSDAGHVRVYNWNGTTWTQLGGDIDGEAAGDKSGWSVAMSTDGNRVAIGAPFNDGGGSDAGHVRVYNWNATNNTWTQVGSDINGEAAGDNSGTSVAMSTDGNRIAISATANDGNGTNSGHVRIYDWNNINGWTQTGTDIDGEAAFVGSGNSVAMSTDGNRIAIGTMSSDGINGSGSGHVRIYDWNNINGWTQTGTDIDGEAASDGSGRSVAMSTDGNRIAISATANDGNGTNSGHVRVYDWNATNNTWTQVGSDIDGENADDRSGHSVAMSSDGARIAIGAIENAGSGLEAGHVRIYDWNNINGWTQTGTDIDGEAAFDQSGYSVAISSDGTKVGIGALWNDGVASSVYDQRGHVRVFSLSVALEISYDSQGGSAVSDGDTRTPIGGSIASLPTDPTRNGYTFAGWYTAASAGTRITAGSPHGQTSDFTLYAQWTADTPPTSTTPTTNTQPTPSSIPTTKLPETGTNSDIWINVGLVLIALGILTRFRTRRTN